MLATASTTAVAAPLDSIAPESSGPVVLIGIDGEDGGPGGHGPAHNYVAMVDAMLAGDDAGILSPVDAGPDADGLVVLGGGKSTFDDVTAMWNHVAEHVDADARDGGVGEPVSFAANEAIDDVDLSLYEIVVVASTAYNTPSGGLTDDENSRVAQRAADIADHVNGGGGLLGLEQSGLAENQRWAYLGDFAQIDSEMADYSNIDPTEEGRSLGIDDNLDVCCWHETFTEYPEFLTTLAYVAGTTDVAALGGTSVSIPSEDCDDLVDNDGDLLVDATDPDCHSSLGLDLLYAALGDSYASGEGNPDFEAGTDEHHDEGDPRRNICHRSPDAWPRLVGQQARIDKTIFRACSGAVRVDVLGTAQYPTEGLPQHRYAGRAVDLITISIGGNDFGFAEVLLECTRGAEECTQHEDDYQRDIAAQRPLLSALYETLINDQHAPTARLVVIGYPGIFPDPDTVDDVDGCGDLDAPWLVGRAINANEAKMLRRLTVQAEEMLRLAANNAQVEFVPMADAFAGHELCTDEPWANDAPGKDELDEHERAFTYHPNASGHRAMADRVIDYLDLALVGDFPALPIA